MGAILQPWDGMVWAPIGQYAMIRGAVSFDEVRARFLKLEISNLVVEPYDSFTVKQPSGQASDRQSDASHRDVR